MAWMKRVRKSIKLAPPSLERWDWNRRKFEREVRKFSRDRARKSIIDHDHVKLEWSLATTRIPGTYLESMLWWRMAWWGGTRGTRYKEIAAKIRGHREDHWMAAKGSNNNNNLWVRDSCIDVSRDTTFCAIAGLEWLWWRWLLEIRRFGFHRCRLEYVP